MSFFGFNKKTDKEIQRDNERALRKTGRDLEREKVQLDREEQKLILEIKKAAKDNNEATTKMYAKNLVQLRRQKQRMLMANSRIQSVATSTKVMGANARMAEAMSSTTKAMGAMNKAMNPQQLNQTLQEFSKQSMKMDMTDEMINDTLDDIMNESGDEEEEDAVISKVLDEIGIEISGKLAKAPIASKDKIGLPEIPSTDDLEERIAKLKSQ